jgi:hypothetical protein
VTLADVGHAGSLGRPSLRRANVGERTAERPILTGLGRGSIDDLDDGTRFGTEIILLSALIAETTSTMRLDGFLTEARQLADHWLS